MARLELRGKGVEVDLEPFKESRWSLATAWCVCMRVDAWLDKQGRAGGGKDRQERQRQGGVKERRVMVEEEFLMVKDRSDAGRSLLAQR